MKTFLRAFLLLALFFFLSFSVSTAIKPQAISLKLGFSFSPGYAEDLGLDPRDAFVEILETFDFETVRIPIYWNRVYENGHYNFSEVEFMVEEAKSRNLEVVLSLGYRNFRWPECYAPEKIKDKTYPSFEQELLSYVGEVMEEFSTREEIDFWQVENEPFLHSGKCRYLRPSTLLKEIEQVRYSDKKNRPILLTFGGGEVLGFPLFWPLFGQADIIGVSFYPHYHDPIFGIYFQTYRLGPLSPRMIRREREFVEGQGREFWVVEAQVEPWGEDPRTMSPKVLGENWDLLLSQGAAERVYLWGVEWWIKEKREGRPQMIEEALNLFGNVNLEGR